MIPIRKNAGCPFASTPLTLNLLLLLTVWSARTAGRAGTQAAPAIRQRTATPIVPFTGADGPSPTPSPSLTARPTSTSTPTLSRLVATAGTQTARFPIADCSRAPRACTVSQNRTLLAVACLGGVLKVMSPGWTSPRGLNYADVYGREYGSPGGPLARSNDSPYPYFVAAPQEGTDLRLADGAALLRLQVPEGRVSAAVRGADYRQARFAFAISPDGRTLALIDEGHQPPQFALRGIGESGEQQIPLNRESNDRREKYRQAGRILWSVDGNRIIVGLSTEDENPPPEAEILLLDLTDGSQRVLLETQGSLPAPPGWLDKHTNLIEDPLAGESRDFEPRNRRPRLRII